MIDVNKENAVDHELASQAASGDGRAFEEIYERHRARVYSIALRMTRNAADAEDIAQESFITLLRKIGQFRGESAFVSWLCRLTINQVLMHFRKAKSRPEETTADGEMPEYKSSGVKTAKATPVLDRIALKRAVNALPRGYRRAFVLFDVAGFDHQEIARMTGCAVGTSKSQLNNARASLRKLLSPQPFLFQT